MESKDKEKKLVIAYAFLLFDRQGPLRPELISDIINEVFRIPFKDLPRFLSSSQYVNFALLFWKCMVQSRLKYGV